MDTLVMLPAAGWYIAKPKASRATQNYYLVLRSFTFCHIYSTFLLWSLSLACLYVRMSIFINLQHVRQHYMSPFISALVKKRAFLLKYP
jgi:hypothetical protein